MLDNLIHILKRSVEKNGEIPLTNKHLLNMMKLVAKKEIDDDDEYHNIADDRPGY